MSNQKNINQNAPNSAQNDVKGDLFTSKLMRGTPISEEIFDLPANKNNPVSPPKPSHLWRNILYGSVLGIIALLAMTTLYFYRAAHLTVKTASDYGTTTADIAALTLAKSTATSGFVIINGNANVNGSVTADNFNGNGADLSNVNATRLNSQLGSFYQNADNINAGVLSDARLSGNVALLDASQAFSGSNSFTNTTSFVNLLVSGTTTMSGAVTINNTLTTSGNSNVGGDLTVTGTTNINGLSYSWPGAQGSGILANDGAGNLAWQAVGACASCITNGGNAFGSSISIGTNDANTLSLRTNGADQLTVDTTGQVGIGTGSPGYKLDVNGDVNIAAGNAFRIGGTAICTSGGCAAQSGSGSYVQNSATLQTGVNFNFEIASINSVGGVIRAKAGQVSDLQQWQDSGGVALAYVDSYGDITANSALKVNGTTVCTASGCTATGGSGSYIQNGTTLQTTANFNIQSASASSVVAVLRAATGQTANLLQFQNQSGIVIGGVASSGSAWFGGTSSPGGRLGISPDTAASLGLVVQGRASQTANLQEWQDSTGSALSYVDSSGNIAVDHTGKAILRLRSTNSDQSELIFGSGTSNMFFFDPVGGGIRVYVNASERARFNTTGTFQVNSPTNTVGTVEKFRVNTPTTVDNLANVIFGTSATTTKGLVVQGLTSQTANLQEWQNSTGTVLNRVASTGAIQLGFNIALQGEYSGGGTFVDLIKRGSSNDVWVGSTTTETDIQAVNYITFLTSGAQRAQISANTFKPTTTRGLQFGAASSLWANGYFGSVNASSVGLHVVASVSQTANLQQWEDSSGNVLSSIDASGNLLLGRASGATGSAILYNSGGAGGITLTGANPGASSYTITFPAETGTVCTTASAGACTSAGGFVQLQASSPGTAQTGNLNISGVALAGTAVSVGSNAATVGAVRLPNATSISWRNAAGTADKSISLSSTNVTDGLNLPGNVIVGGSDATAGALYFFNSAVRILRTAASGIQLITTGTTGIALNSSGQVGINPATNTFTGGTVERLRVNTPTTVDNLANVIFSASSATSKPLVIQGAASQTANLQEWQDSTGAALAYVNATGDRFGLALATGKSFRPILADDVANNIFDLDYNGQINVDSSVSGSIIRQGQNGVHIFTHPAGSSTLTDRLTVSADGAIQQRGYVAIQNTTSSGQANLALQIADDAGNNQMLRVQSYTFGVGKFGNGVTSSPGTLTVYGSDTTTPTVIARAIASQTSNLQEWQDSSGAVIAKVDSLGRATFGSSSTGLSGVTATGTYAGLSAASYGGTAIYANAQSTATVGLKVQSASVLYTGDLQRWDPGGVTASSVTNSGFFKIGATGTLGTVEKLRISDPTTADNSANVMIATSAITSKGLVIQGTASQTANLQEWQDSTGTVLASVNSAGRILVGDTSSGGIRFGSLTGSLISQTGTNITWSTPTGGYLFLSANPTGIIYLGTASDTAGIQLRRDTQITSNNAAVTKLAVKGATSQTANLQEWQDSTGVVKSLVDSSGRIVVGSSMNSIPAAIGINNYTTTSNDLVIQHGDSFGGIVMVNYGTPGSNFGGKLTLGHADGTFASPTQPGSGRIVGTVNFNAWETGSSFQNVASIQAAVDTTSGTGDWPGRLVFNTTPDGSTTVAERMRIDSTGNIYIGNGAQNAAPVSGIIGATGGSGVDIAGANLTLAGGRGTGAAIGGGISFQTSIAGASGAALRSLSTVFSLSGGIGAAAFKNTSNGTGAFIITDSTATNNVVNVDTANDRVAIGTGTANPTVTLDVLSAGADATTVAQFKNAGATSCTVQPGGTGFACSSDARLKTNVLTLEKSSDIVNKLRGVSFNWINNPTGQIQSGFIAQELMQVIPGAVSQDSNGFYVANYSAIVPYLVNAFQDTDKRLSTIEAKLNDTQVSQGVFNGGIVTGDTEFQAKATFDGLASFKGQTVFAGGSTFEGVTNVKGRLQLGNNNTGTTTITAGNTITHVVLPSGFSAKPNVNLTPQDFVDGQYRVTNVTTTGFDVETSVVQSKNTAFYWQAF